MPSALVRRERLHGRWHRSALPLVDPLGPLVLASLLAAVVLMRRGLAEQVSRRTVADGPGRLGLQHLTEPHHETMRLFHPRPMLVAITVALVAVSCASPITTSSSPTPAAATPAATAAVASTTPSATGGGAPRGPVARRPQGYVLPTECQYVDDGTTQGTATAWKISCPQGLPSTYLAPSLAAQSWVSCGPKMWSKSPLQIAVFDAVNVSGFTGWLDQRPLSAGSCAYPTAPAGS